MRRHVNNLFCGCWFCKWEREAATNVFSWYNDLINDFREEESRFWERYHANEKINQKRLRTLMKGLKKIKQEIKKKLNNNLKKRLKQG